MYVYLWYSITYSLTKWLSIHSKVLIKTDCIPVHYEQQGQHSNPFKWLNVDLLHTNRKGWNRIKKSSERSVLLTTTTRMNPCPRILHKIIVAEFASCRENQPKCPCRPFPVILGIQFFLILLIRLAYASNDFEPS